MRILYIEDDSTSRAVFVNGIRKQIDYCEVEAVETGEEGLTRLDAGCFDLLVTDLQLPGMSGLDVLRECKRTRPELAVVVLTGHGSVDSAVEAMHLGATDYIEKPLDLALMREKIENVREYLQRYTELSDLREAKGTVERQAGHELHLLEAQTLKARDAVDEALAALARGPMSEELAASLRAILTPVSSQPKQDCVGRE